MKTAEPEIVKEWRAVLDAGAPRCCHTCEYYNARGDCEKFAMRPPDEFTHAVNICGDWKVECPF